MSCAITAAKRRRSLLLATGILTLSASIAHAQTPPANLPPVDVNPPTDQNRPRAKPVTDEGTGTRRVVRPAPTNTTSAAPSDGTRASPSSGGTCSGGGAAVRHLNGI